MNIFRFWIFDQTKKTFKIVTVGYKKLLHAFFTIFWWVGGVVILIIVSLPTSVQVR